MGRHREPSRTYTNFQAGPRTRFKQSYAPAEAESATRGGSAVAWGGQSGDAEAADPVSRRREAQLERELQEARTEIQQLRNALRASAHALQHASGLLPPEIGQDVDAQRQILDDLSKQLRDRDDEILRLRKKTYAQDDAASAQREVALRAAHRWASSHGSLVLKEFWMLWKPLAQERRLAKEFEKRLESARLLDADKMARVVQSLFGESLASMARAALGAWSTVAHSARGEADRRKITEERTQRAILRLGAGCKQQLLEVTMACWRRFHDLQSADRHAEAARAEQLRANRALKKESIMKTTMAFASKSDGELDDYAIRMVLRAWLSLLLDKRARDKVGVEEKRAKEAQERYQKHLQRNFVLLMNRDGKQLLGALFATWLECVKETKKELKLADERQRAALFHAWQVITMNNRRKRELDKERARIAEAEAAHEMERRSNQIKRKNMMFFNVEAQTSLLTHVAWTAWMDFLSEARRERERNEERAAWEQEFETLRTKQAEQERNRSVMLALSGGLGGRLLLKVALSAWQQAVEESRRLAELDAKQQIFEDERRKTLEEAEALRAEAAESNMRHQDAEKRRQLVFIMSLEDSKSKASEDMLLHTMFAAWFRCWQDARVDQERIRTQVLEKDLGKLKQLLGVQPEQVDREGHLLPGSEALGPKLSCWARFCRCCCRCSKKSKPAKVSPAKPTDKTVSDAETYSAKVAGDSSTIKTDSEKVASYSIMSDSSISKTDSAKVVSDTIIQ